eukprot:gene34304-41519_t
MGCSSSNAANNPQASPPQKPEATTPPSTARPASGSANSAPAKPELPHTFAARYKLGDILGEGGYSVVKLGISNVDKKKVAVKIVTRNGLSQDDEESLRAEVKILTALNYPNI